MQPYDLPLTAVAPFIVLPLVIALLLMWGTAYAYRRKGRTGKTLLVAAGAAVWMATTWMVASSGVFRRWDAVPPPFALLIVTIAILSLRLSFSPFGQRLATAIPLWVLVLVQSFRLPLELAMHAMYQRGVMPVEMSYSGRNFDIVTGITALVLALLTRSGGRRGLVLAWNIMGLVLVLNVVTVAVLATPRFRYFGDEHLNVWVTYPPFVWLPAVLVLAAVAGHLIIFRALSTAGVRAGNA